MMLKGLIFYENSDVPVRDGIVSSGRPVVIVSGRASGTVVQVVPLTTSENKLMDNAETHVPIASSGRQSVALCDQLRTVPLRELSATPKARCSDEEMDAIDDALCRMLGFEYAEDDGDA